MALYEGSEFVKGKVTLLNINKVIGDNDVMDAKTLPRVKMPNRDNFFPEFPKLTPQRP